MLSLFYSAFKSWRNMKYICLFLLSLTMLAGCGEVSNKWEYLSLLRTAGPKAVNWSVSYAGDMRIIGLGSDTEATTKAIQSLGGKVGNIPLDTDIYNALGAKGWELISCQTNEQPISGIHTIETDCLFKRKALGSQ